MFPMVCPYAQINSAYFGCVFLFFYPTLSLRLVLGACLSICISKCVFVRVSECVYVFPMVCPYAQTNSLRILCLWFF